MRAKMKCGVLLQKKKKRGRMELGLIDNRIGPTHVLLGHKEHGEVKASVINSKNKVKGLP